MTITAKTLSVSLTRFNHDGTFLAMEMNVVEPSASVGTESAGTDLHQPADQPSSERKLPDCSKKAVYVALRAVRTAKRNQQFSAGWLKHEHGIGQNGQAMRLLRFLDFLDDHANLRSDVLDNRTNLQLFAQLLRDRVQRGCQRAGVPQDLSKRLGNEEHEWSQLRGDLDGAPPISSLTSNVRNNVLGSLKALDEVLRHVADDGWLEERVQVPHSKPRRDSGTAPGAIHEQPRYSIPFSAEGEDLTACVVFEGRVRDRSAALKRLGELLVEMADKG